MEKYIVIAQLVAGSRTKFENHRILKIEPQPTVEEQIPTGYEKVLGPASLDDCVKHLKELNDGQPNWFALTVAQYLLIAVVTLTFVGVVSFGAWRLYDLSSDPNLKLITTVDDAARVLITFLVAVSTVAIAFLAILTAMVIREYKERFALAKEILTLLVGILGTIVGFYFGAATKANVGNPPAPPTNTNTARPTPSPVNSPNSNLTSKILRESYGKEIALSLQRKRKLG